MASRLAAWSPRGCLPPTPWTPPPSPHTWRLSAEKATDSTSLVCPRKRRVVAPVEMSQRRRVPSQEPVRQNWPSEEMTTSCTVWEWPRSARLG